MTRFLIMSREHDDAPNNGKVVTSFVFQVKNVPAALYKAMGGFATNGVNMTKLESYQLGGSFNATQFYADIQGHPDDPPVHRALEELAFFTARLIIMGVYPAHPFREDMPLIVCQPDASLVRAAGRMSPVSRQADSAAHERADAWFRQAPAARQWPRRAPTRGVPRQGRMGEPDGAESRRRRVEIAGLRHPAATRPVEPSQHQHDDGNEQSAADAGHARYKTAHAATKDCGPKRRRFSRTLVQCFSHSRRPGHLQSRSQQDHGHRQSVCGCGQIDQSARERARHAQYRKRQPVAGLQKTGLMKSPQRQWWRPGS